MDYKYIEQLLEQYFQGRTTIEEERILQTFFEQEDIPEALKIYTPLFEYSKVVRNEETLGNDFDNRILSLTEDITIVKARKMTFIRRLYPLFKVAATVIFIITLGCTVLYSLNSRTNKSENLLSKEEQNTQGTVNDLSASSGETNDYTIYADTYSDPIEAFNKVQNALKLVSKGIKDLPNNEQKNNFTTKNNCAIDSDSNQEQTQSLNVPPIMANNNIDTICTE